MVTKLLRTLFEVAEIITRQFICLYIARLLSKFVFNNITNGKFSLKIEPFKVLCVFFLFEIHFYLTRRILIKFCLFVFFLVIFTQDFLVYFINRSFSICRTGRLVKFVYWNPKFFQFILGYKLTHNTFQVLG